jgi:outer membrane biosynthesis protein TonB
MMAAAVIVGAIGAAEGARRLGFDWSGRDAGEAPPVQVTAAVEDATPPDRQAMSRDTSSAAKVVPKPKAVAARSAARPKAGTAAGQRARVREANRSVQQTVPVASRAASPEMPASAPARPSAVEPARPRAPLTGRFFESNDVDEPPRIASRVAPRLPANLPAGADKKIVVARVLVSRDGHPHRVSLLRGSSLGRASDEAVVAAVTQWTFSPARKRGEPVNCWYNIGIPLGQAD